jgi:Sperm-tail PG-rich repeat
MLAQAKVKTPSPFEYTIGSDFKKRPTSRAFTFGVSREFFKKVYLKENPPVDDSKPGPNQYMIKRDVTESSPSKYSLRPKTAKDCSFQNYTKFVPGPGTYSVKASESNNKGFIVNSRYKSGGCAIISRGSQRFSDPSMKATGVPGPGNYHPKGDMDRRGNYTVARFRNSGAPFFPKAGRDTNLDTSKTRKSKH